MSSRVESDDSLTRDKKDCHKTKPSQLTCSRLERKSEIASGERIGGSSAGGSGIDMFIGSANGALT